MFRKHAPLLTVALAVVLGAQQMRVLFPSIGWYLRDTEQLGVIDLIPYALAPFALSLLAPLLVWIFRPKIALYHRRIRSLRSTPARTNHARTRSRLMGIDGRRHLLPVAVHNHC